MPILEDIRRRELLRNAPVAPAVLAPGYRPPRIGVTGRMMPAPLDTTFDAPDVDYFPKPELPFTELNKRAAEVAEATLTPRGPIAKTNASAAPLASVGPGTTVAKRPSDFGVVPSWIRAGSGPGSFTRPLDALPLDASGNVRARSLGEMASTEQAKGILDAAYGQRGYPGTDVEAARAADLSGLEYGARRGVAQARAANPLGFEGTQTAAEIKSALGMSREEFTQALVEADKVAAKREGRPWNPKEAQFAANAAWLDFYGEFLRNKAGRYVPERALTYENVLAQQALAGQQ